MDIFHPFLSIKITTAEITSSNFEIFSFSKHIMRNILQAVSCFRLWVYWGVEPGTTIYGLNLDKSRDFIAWSRILEWIIKEEEDSSNFYSFETIARVNLQPQYPSYPIF